MRDEKEGRRKQGQTNKQTRQSNTAHPSLDKSKLVELTEYLIDNVYVKAGNRVYRQTIGIPMGTDCAPQLANLYLFHHEYMYMYMRALMESNLHVHVHVHM